MFLQGGKTVVATKVDDVVTFADDAAEVTVQTTRQPAAHSVVASTVDDVVEGANSAFDMAKVGGKHAGFYKNYLGKSSTEIKKAINTLQAGKRGIDVHLDKIANPSKYVQNWNTLRASHQQSLIKRWQKEIINAREQIQILKGILGE
ncbi:hypothetical protein L0152_18130 [bacterium]|nr:hypothetical protein [bacterium]